MGYDREAPMGAGDGAGDGDRNWRCEGVVLIDGFGDGERSFPGESRKEGGIEGGEGAWVIPLE